MPTNEAFNGVDWSWWLKFAALMAFAVGVGLLRRKTIEDAD